MAETVSIPIYRASDDFHAVPAIATTKATSGDASRVFGLFYWRVVGAYVWCSLENVFRVLQPFVLGVAINDLLHQSYRGTIVFAIQHLVYMSFRSVRTLQVTRTFGRIRSRMMVDTVADGRECVAGSPLKKGTGTLSMTVAQRSQQQSPRTNPLFQHSATRMPRRLNRLKQSVRWLEVGVPRMIAAGFSIAGGLMMIGWFDWSLLPWCVGLFVPVLLLNSAYARRVRDLQWSFNRELERETQVVESGDADDIAEHCASIAAWRSRLADTEAVSFSLRELFVLSVIVAVLVRYCANPEVNAGDIFAVVGYVLMFVHGLETIQDQRCSSHEPYIGY